MRTSGSGSGQGKSTGGDTGRASLADFHWTLLREGEGARFLFRLAKSARKRSAGLTVVTQDVADLLGSDLGHAVAANAATQILMRQSVQSIDAVTRAFGLTAGEAQMLLTAGRGHALLVAGSSTRVAFRTVASPKEHALATTGLDVDRAARSAWLDPGLDPGTDPVREPTIERTIEPTVEPDDATGTGAEPSAAARVLPRAPRTRRPGSRPAR